MTRWNSQGAPERARAVDPGCYCVVFSSRRTAGDDDGYRVMAQRMIDLAQQQAGFLGVESVRDDAGQGITVSYWNSLESIERWRANSEHLAAQELGRSRWYREYGLKICRVIREYSWQG